MDARLFRYNRVENDMLRIQQPPDHCPAETGRRPFLSWTLPPENEESPWRS